LYATQKKVSKAEEHTKLSINIVLSSKFFQRISTLAFCQVVISESKKFYDNFNSGEETNSGTDGDEATTEEGG
jgi:hypothetical protein